MKKKDNSSRVSIANFLAVVGLAGLGVVVFFGLMLLSEDGGLTGPALISVGLLAGLLFFIILSIKAKGADNNPDKWRYVEIAALVCYLAVAFFTVKPFVHFFDVVTHKSEIKAMANQEIQGMRSFYIDYSTQVKKELDNSQRQLLNYMQSPNQDNIQINNYLEKHHITKSSLDDWYKKSIESMSVDYDVWLDSIGAVVEEWKLMKLNYAALALEKKEQSVGQEINKLIDEKGLSNELIPVIIKYEGSVNQETDSIAHASLYSYNGLYKFSLPEVPKSNFANALRGDSMKSPLGWLLFILLHVIILLSYLVAERSNYVRPAKDGYNDEGVDL